MGIHGPWQSVCVIRVRKVKDDMITPRCVIGSAIADRQIANAEAVAILIHDHGDQANLALSLGASNSERSSLSRGPSKVVHHRPEEFNGDH